MKRTWFVSVWEAARMVQAIRRKGTFKKTGPGTYIGTIRNERVTVQFCNHTQAAALMVFTIEWNDRSDGRRRRPSGGNSPIVEKLKTELLDELHLMRPWLEEYRRQSKSSKPNLVYLANQGGPLGDAIKEVSSQIRTSAATDIDPFGFLLEQVNITEWTELCRVRKMPWINRVWLAAASQLRSELRLVAKAHGWSDTYQTLRQNPDNLRAADDYFLALLGHAKEDRRSELLAAPPVQSRLAKAKVEQDEAFLKRQQRAKRGDGKRAGVSLAEKFMVQYWLALPCGLPGLCFFSDTALHSLLVIFELHPLKKTEYHVESHVTTLTRGRLGLLQAAAKQHVVEVVEAGSQEVRFAGRLLKEPWKFTGKINWGRRVLWAPDKS